VIPGIVWLFARAVYHTALSSPQAPHDDCQNAPFAVRIG
jgi:hypothetical protein